MIVVDVVVVDVPFVRDTVRQCVALACIYLSSSFNLQFFLSILFFFF